MDSGWILFRFCFCFLSYFGFLRLWKILSEPLFLLYSLKSFFVNTMLRLEVHFIVESKLVKTNYFEDFSVL